DDAPRDLAVRALRAVHRRPPERRRVDGDPGLCHGLAGLLHITSRLATTRATANSPAPPPAWRPARSRPAAAPASSTAPPG
ncbi:lanthionine synthetase C family protein, partial [Streptomyces sp. SCA2-4]|nr:lanthionine synthetase C family protein [Streptomyces huiliensis]